MDDQQPIADLLQQARDHLYDQNRQDTAGVLRTAWDAFCVAGAVTHVLTICADPDGYGPLWETASPVLSTAITELRRALSLPEGLPTQLNPAGGPDDRIDDQTASRVQRGLHALAVELNAALSEAAGHARLTGDRHALQQATMLASELADCYEGRLRSYLNPWREHFGPGSFVVKGRGDAHRRR
ncbi:hypothetical protein LP52_04985 [Streptomonospora alba]|uniref:DUF4254 domain-containing protein n=1 Tax=Streptomonospora alba TaxID=183763 RepID=A0A0C2JSN9_9ACTN|nr:hypothetical protein [Streptomonospora alba]KIH99857.1 hypothetical protein LP52_04985 [Streptomonospora alba]